MLLRPELPRPVHRLSTAVNGTYELVREMGRGGMGIVYEARHQGTGRRVALKTILETRLRTASALARFEREVRVIALLDSQYIVDILDAGRDRVSGNPFMVMELLKGFDLGQVVRRGVPLPPDLVLRIGAQVCLGLQKAHEAEIIHRDIKPANLFVAQKDGGECLIKILDFGVAKMHTAVTDWPEDSVTQAGGVLGSPAYMSPEQVQGLDSVDQRADIWSLGAVLYELAAGHRPHPDAETLGRLIVRLCTVAPPTLSAISPAVPRELSNLVERALQLDPARRFQSCGEMFAAIVRLLPNGWSIRQDESRALFPSAQEIGGREATHEVPASESTVVTVDGVVGSNHGKLRRLGRPLPGRYRAVARGGLALGILALLALSYDARVREAPASASLPALDLQTDPENCGQQGKSCEGGACLAGACQPVALVTRENAPELFVPRQIAIDSENLYLADYSDFDDSGNPGDVYQVPLEGGRVEVLARDQKGPFGIASDGRHVYWTNFDGGTVMRVPVGGGTHELLAMDQGRPSYIGLDDENVYWTNFYHGAERTPFSGSVATVPKQGGPVRILADEQDYPNGIAVAGGTVYWVNWANYDDGRAGSVRSVASTGGPISVLASNEVHPMHLTVDNRDLYFTSAFGVKRIVLGKDGTVDEVVAGPSVRPALIAHHDDFLYWTDRGRNLVVQTSKRGTAEVTIAGGQVEAFGIAADSKRTYWVMRDGVMKVVR